MTASAAQLRTLAAQQADLQQQEQVLRQQLAARRRPLVTLLAAIQRLAHQPPALALVDAGAPARRARINATLAALVPQARRQAAAYQTDLRHLAELSDGLRRTQAQLQAHQARLLAERDALIRTSALRLAQAGQLDRAALTAGDQAIAAAEAARGRVRPGRALAPRPAGWTLPAPGRVLTEFGTRLPDGQSSPALVLLTPPTAVVRAPRAGRITFANRFPGYGALVIIDHGGGWTSVISELQELSVRRGQTVAQGTPLGRTAAVQPRLGIEVQHQGRPVDVGRLAG